jgi:ketosteroid isomerase-like protein
MSENLDLVRSIYAPMERGDFSRADWAHPEIECVMVGGPEPGSGSGLAAMATGWGEVLGAWEDFRVEVDDYREVDDERVLALIRFSGRGKTSGLEIATKGAALFQLHDGKVDRIVHYWDRDRALADLGLEGLAMSEEPTTPDPVELVRKHFEAGNRRDIDAVVSSFAVDAVFDGRALGDHFEGRAAIRGFVEGWFGMYEELEFKLEEVHELGNGVVFAVVVQEARPSDIAGHVRQREGWVYVWVEGLITRFTVSDIDEARAAAERLAEERG